MSLITGKTNGANSSEYKLAKIAVLLIPTATAIAVTAGFLSPEHADQWNDALMAFVGSIAAIVSVYAHGRSKIKASIAANGESPKE